MNAYARTSVAGLLSVFAVILLPSCETTDVATALQQYSTASKKGASSSYSSFKSAFSKKPGRSSSLFGGSTRIYSVAKTWEGRYFRSGVSHQCANWVSHVVSQAGQAPPAGSSSSRSWIKWGKSVPVSQIRPGDVLVFKNTYKGGISHVGIAAGNGQFIHRSSRKKPVKISSLSRYQIASVRRN